MWKKGIQIIYLCPCIDVCLSSRVPSSSSSPFTWESFEYSKQIQTLFKMKRLHRAKCQLRNQRQCHYVNIVSYIVALAPQHGSSHAAHTCHSDSVRRCGSGPFTQNHSNHSMICRVCRFVKDVHILIHVSMHVLIVTPPSTRILILNSISM